MAMQWLARRMVPLAGRPQHLPAAFFSSISPTPPVPRASSAAAPSPWSFQWESPPELCGRGDKRTKRGKRFKGSYGNARPKLKKKIERIKDKVEVPQSTPWPLPFKLI